jgi:hypothetical protein
MHTYNIISDEELENLLGQLPVDSEEALVILDRHLRHRADADNGLRDQYISILRGFIAQSGFIINVPGSCSYTDFCNILDNVKSTIIFRKNKLKKVGLYPTVDVPKEDKKIIHNYINEIRNIIENGEFTEQKKENLFLILGNLEIEVDQPKTPIERVLAAIWAIDEQIKDAAEKSAIAGIVKNIWDTICKYSSKNLRITVQTPKITLVAEQVSNDT